MILIIAVVTGTGVAIGRSAMDSTQRVSTNNRLDTIEKSLLTYRLVNNRLPCPADGTLAKSNAGFGLESGAPGACTQNFTATVNGSTVVEGVVPVRSLNLPDEYMYDGWGNKIAYAVWTPITAIRAFFNYGTALNCGLITVQDPSHNSRSSQADYVLLSYGKNGHGAFNANGTTRNSSGSTNADEQKNCHCDANAVDTGYQATYIQQDATDDPTSSLKSFDDIVRYKERWQLQNYNDWNNAGGGMTCPKSNSLPGFRSAGVNGGDNSGASVAVGDVNGDGIPDLIIGAPGANGTGSVYVVFGTTKGFPDPLPLGSLNGTNGFRIDGVNAGDQTGFSVASADVNGDGISDIIIGAPGASGASGKAFVVFGNRTTPWATPFALSSALNVSTGLRLNGAIASGQAGYAVAAGDVNNDGYADIVIGAPNSADGGHVYTVFGAATYAASTYNLDSSIIDGTQGFRIDAINGTDAMGWSVAVGDTNGDGIADIVMGSPGYNSNTGMVSILMGKGRGSWYTPMKTINLIGFNGWHMLGINSGDKTGSSLAVGDINSDGIDDILIGAPGASPGGRLNAGIVYAVFGNNAAKPKDFYLSKINSTNGFEMDGVAAGDNAGTSVAVGDINGDGFGDIIIGAPGTAGSAYVVFGANSATSPFALSGLNGTNGFQLNGALAGSWAVAAGDINGDNQQDVIIGAKTASANTGSTYVYFGQKKTSGWATPLNLSGL